jgi:hypothetical protein
MLTDSHRNLLNSGPKAKKGQFGKCPNPPLYSAISDTFVAKLGTRWFPEVNPLSYRLARAPSGSSNAAQATQKVT